MLIHIGFAFPAEIEIGCIFTTDARTYTHSRITRTNEKKGRTKGKEGKEGKGKESEKDTPSCVSMRVRGQENLVKNKSSAKRGR